jgi:NADH-quinone oxidoreductase subunit J
MNPFVFYIASFFIVITVMLMIFQRNPVISALYLVASFFGLAVLYVLLDAHFVAALQILVYAGAVMVLFVFVIMLLNLKPEDMMEEPFSLKNLILMLVVIAASTFVGYAVFTLPPVSLPPLSDGFGSPDQVSLLMLSDYIVPFEILGFVLLVGLLGAVVLGREDKKS